MKLNKKTLIFIIAIIICAILKQLLVCNLPICANVPLGADDGLMINQAESIIKGTWLGAYSETTFLKGPVFPLFLSLIYFLHIDYISAITILYTISCLTLLWVISKVIKNKKILFLIYVILLFNPIMFGKEIMQRVYRNSLIPSFAFFIFAGYINLFFERNTESFKKKIPTIIGLSIVLPLFWYTREDSMWIIPYIIFMCLSILISVIYKNKKVNKEVLKNLVMLFIPVMSIIVFTNIICIKNYTAYGVYTVRNDYYYNKAVKAIESVKANEKVEKVTNTREKMNRIAQITVLGTIMPEFDVLANGYSKIDGNQQDDEVENGWFKFAFTGAASSAGYYKSAQDTNNFYNTLAIQIEDAIEKGLLEKEETKTDYLKLISDVWSYAKECVTYIFKYTGIEVGLENTAREYRVAQNHGFQNFAKITRNKFIYSEKSDKVNEKDVVDFSKQEEYLDSVRYKADIINNIIVKIYKVLNNTLFVLGLIYYAYCTIGIILKKRRLLENWVILSGFLGAIFTVIIGISYTTVKYFYAITTLYLVATYPLIIAFNVFSVYNGCVEIYNGIKSKNK